MSSQAHPQHDNDRRWACPGLYRMPRAADGGICRIKLDLGRLTFSQMHAVADAAGQYGNGAIELTTRGNIQIRGVAGKNTRKLADTLTDHGLGPLTEAGDDIRNIMLNPTAGFDISGTAAVVRFAAHLSHTLQTSADYQTLSPKFSFHIDGGETCAVLNHTSDIWLSATGDGRHFAFGLASCPPVDDDTAIQAPWVVRQTHGEAVITALLDCLLQAAGKDSSIRRMKHLVRAWGYERIMASLKQKIPGISPAGSFRRKEPPGRLDLGIHQTRFPGRFYLGIRPPLGRLTPQLLHDTAQTAEAILVSQRVQVTPWQGFIFPDCSHDQAAMLAGAFRHMGMATDITDPLARITCCAGLPGCACAIADVQTDARRLAAVLQENPRMTVHLSACAKSCTSTVAGPVTLLAVQPGLYDIYYQVQQPDTKFGRLAAGKVAIDDVAAVLSAGFPVDFLPH